MCGIFAYINSDTIKDFSNLHELFMTMRHRGPEFSSFDLIGPHVILGFHRLAIMDLTTEGNQPFHHISKYAICNGEIYNHKELASLINYEPKSHSDCEIILPLFEVYDVEISKLLGSEFATIIVELLEDGPRVVIIRDPIGVRPLFFSRGQRDLMLASEAKGLVFEDRKIEVFPPGHYAVFQHNKLEITPYYTYPVSYVPTSFEQSCSIVRESLITAVKSRLETDRKFGCLLSGGLDSSLVVGILKYLLPNVIFPVFTISFKGGSTDLPFAKELAESLNLEHHIIEIDEEEALKEINETIYAIESYDITTVRAATMQRILARYIKERTDITVVFTGEGSDELFLGYMYEHLAPSVEDAHEDSLRLIRDVHCFDGLRTDRTMSYHSLEVRVPFCDEKLVTKVLELNPSHVVPSGEGKKIEKYLLRSAFSGLDIIPESIIWRQKEAFSDAVSKHERSWYIIIQEHFDRSIPDEEFEIYRSSHPNLTPLTKESYHYREVFEFHFGDRYDLIPYYWMPRWSESKDPSARTLK